MKFDVNLLDYLAYGLIFVRIGVFLFFVPVFSETAISSRIRIYIAFWFMLVMAPSLQGSFPKEIDNLGILATHVIHEVLVGAALGLVMKFTFLTLEFAGSLISQAMGLTNVSFNSPNIGGQISLPSNLLMLAATVLFIETDIHHHFIRFIWQSYTLLPADSFNTHDLTQSLLKSSQNMMALGFKLSTPLVVFGLLVSIALGLLNRLIPQVQIFMVSQPLQLGFGFFVLLYAIRELLMTFLKDYEYFLLGFK